MVINFGNFFIAIPPTIYSVIYKEKFSKNKIFVENIKNTCRVTDIIV